VRPVGDQKVRRQAPVRETPGVVAKAAVAGSGFVDDQQAGLLSKFGQRFVEVQGLVVAVREHGCDILEIVDHIGCGADGGDSEKVRIAAIHPETWQADAMAHQPQELLAPAAWPGPGRG
jgi:hypothetical protein